MTILTCTSAKRWDIAFYVLGSYFTILFFISIFPFFKYCNIISSLSRISQALRILISICLILKSITYLFGPLYHDSFPEESIAQPLFTIVFTGLGCDLISTCYTLFLLSWLQTVASYLPTLYSKILNIFTKILIIYNILIYLLFLVKVIIHISYGFRRTQSELIISIIAYATRDFFLGIIFLIFLLLIRKIFIHDNYQDITKEEISLFTITILLFIILIIRGSIVICQMVCFNSNDFSSKGECGIVFFVLFIIFELVIEGAPLIYIIFQNITYCIKVSSPFFSTSLLDSVV